MKALALFLSAALLAAACDGSPADGVPEALRVGLEAKYPPFEEAKPDGTFEGLDVDLARGIGERLGRDVVFHDLPFDTLIPELQAGRLDFVCSAVSRTDERAKVVDFSRPYARVPMGVLVSAARGADLRTLDDLDSEAVHIAVQRGTSGETKARARFPRAVLLIFDTEVDAANEVASGRNHAFVYDMVSIAKLAAVNGSKVRILDGDLGTDHYCIAFPKGSKLVAPVNAYLEDASPPGGELDAIMKRWLPEPERFRVGGK